jgi:hypothetical protein
MPTSVVEEPHNLFTDRRAYQTHQLQTSSKEHTITLLANKQPPRPHNHHALCLLQPSLATRPHPLRGPNTNRRLPSPDAALRSLEPRVLAPGVVADPRQGSPPRPLLGASLGFAAEMLDARRRAVSADPAGRVRDASARRRRQRRRQGGTRLVVRSNRDDRAPVAVEGERDAGWWRDALGWREGQLKERD